MRTAPSVSERARSYRVDPPFINAINRAVEEPYHPDTNPDGYINVGVAENTLMSDIMVQALDDLSRRHPLEPIDLNYTDFAGAPKFREALARYFEKYIF